jgi:hypothetical protein
MCRLPGTDRRASDPNDEGSAASTSICRLPGTTDPIAPGAAGNRNGAPVAQGAAFRFRRLGRYSAATATGFSIGTPMRLPYSVHEPS